MNTLVNHGYIPWNGIVTLAQAIEGREKLFNMGMIAASAIW